MRESPWTSHPETPADAPGVHAVNAAAFPTAAEAELVDALRADPSWIEGFSRVVWDNRGRVIGHALLTRCHIGTAPALCLAPCAVDPAFQRQGVGTTAISDLLRAARERGESAVVVLGDPEYYARFGFAPAKPHGIAAPMEVPEDALMVLTLDGSPPPAGLVHYAAPFGI